jgi:hypothetical protein
MPLLVSLVNNPPGVDSSDLSGYPLFFDDVEFVREGDYECLREKKV